MIAVALSSAWKPLCASSVRSRRRRGERVQAPGFRIVLDDEDERRLTSADRCPREFGHTWLASYPSAKNNCKLGCWVRHRLRATGSGKITRESRPVARSLEPEEPIRQTLFTPAPIADARGPTPRCAIDFFHSGRRRQRSRRISRLCATSASKSANNRAAIASSRTATLTSSLCSNDRLSTLVVPITAHRSSTMSVLA